MSSAAHSGLLGGAKNFRAVRPYAGADGRRLRPDTLFRSGELSRLTEADLATLHDLNIRLVCDLRSQTEQREYVSRWPDGSLHRKLDLPDRDAANASPDKLFQIIGSLPGGAGAEMAMAYLYRRKPRAYASNLGILFREIIAGDALPLLVHCHAGKDRTGFMVAILLAAAGISRADILEDYTLTAQFFPVEEETVQMVAWAKRSYGHDLSNAAARPMVEARRAYLESSLAEIDTAFGGIDAYLREAVGLSQAERLKYQGQVLE
jgi:protein-tyrosine phosphatase